MESDQSNLEDLMIVWLDDETTSYDSWKNQVRSVVNYVKVFNTLDDLKQYMYKDGRYELICLIARNKLAEEILKKKVLLDRMQCAYLFGIKEQKTNHKVCGFFSSMDTLLTQIAKDVKEYYDWKNPATKVFSPHILLDVDGSFRAHLNFVAGCCLVATMHLRHTLEETNEHSAAFLWWTHLIRGFIDLPVNPESKQKFLIACRQQYEGNKSELQKLDDFEATYSPDKALYWYTRDCFLYRILNKSLRTDNLEYIFKLRFFIVDIYQQLHKLQLSQDIGHITVYRGQIFSRDEFKSIKYNFDSLISLNTFLSTSTDPAVALMYIENNPKIPGIIHNKQMRHSNNDDDCESVFLEIEVNRTNTTKTYPFANISKHSCMKDENEVLFSTASLFKMVEMDQLFGGKWHIKLKLVEEDDTIVKSILKHYERITENFEPPITLTTIGNLLPLMGLEKKKEDYYRLLLEELPVNHPDIESVKRFSMISVTIIGSGLIKYFQERTVQINQKTFYCFAQQIGSCSIGSLIKYIKQKHFKVAKYFIFVIGMQTLRHTRPSAALRRMGDVYLEFITAYSKSKCFIATLPLLPVRESKTFDTLVQRNIQKYNENLIHEFISSDTIEVKYDENVTDRDSNGSIYLNVYGINNLTSSIDNYLYKLIKQNALYNTRT